MTGKKLEITTKIGCVNNCVYCPQAKLLKALPKKSKHMMSLEHFKICIDKLPHDVDIVFGGFCEPFLNPDCTKMILYANKKGYKVHLYTTLVGLNEKDLNLILAEVPFHRNDSKDGLTVHLPSKGQYENICVDGKYLHLLKTILKSEKATFHYHGKELHPKLVNLTKNHIYQFPPQTRAGNVKVEDWETLKRKRGRILCYDNLKRNILLPDGSVVSCCHDYGLKHIFGNLLKSDYESLHTSNEFKKVCRGLSDESIDTLCRYCHYSYDADYITAFHNTKLSMGKIFVGLKALLFGNKRIIH